MIELALKAKLPLISVVTDDLLNYRQVLSELSGLKVSDPPKTISLLGSGESLIVTENMDYVTPDWYARLAHSQRTMVVVNPAKASPLLFDGGILPTPAKMVVVTLHDLLGPDANVDPLLPPLKGLSLRAIGEVMLLTQARVGMVNPTELRRTRGMINAAIQGLTALDTSYDFYELPEELAAWLQLNRKYFVEPTHPKLIPRGLLFEGPPGVGKSMAAKAIANSFGCPLYRMDVATVLDRFVGQSEARVAKILTMCEREAPCVLLIDEVEKLFGDEGDAGVTTRILSQLLWWLSEHQSRVFTVMTTNNASTIPAELYRSGRMDAKMQLVKMSQQQSIVFAGKVLQSMLGKKKPNLKQSTHLNTVMKAKEQVTFSQAEVTDLVYHEIKAQGWL